MILQFPETQVCVHCRQEGKVMQRTVATSALRQREMMNAAISTDGVIDLPPKGKLHENSYCRSNLDLPGLQHLRTSASARNGRRDARHDQIRRQA